VIGNGVSTSGEVIIRGLLIVIRGSLISLTGRLVTIRPSLILIARCLVALACQPTLIARTLIGCHHLELGPT